MVKQLFYQRIYTQLLKPIFAIQNEFYSKF